MIHRIHRSAALALAAAAAVPLGAQSLASVGEVLLAVGDPIAAVPGATVTTSSPFDTPVMDLAGNVLFRGRFAGGGVVAQNDRGLFLGRGGNDLQMILRSGQGDPTLGSQLGGPTTLLNTATNTGLPAAYRISPVGEILMFGVSMTGAGIVTTGTASTGNNSTAILYGPPGALTVLARRGAAFTTPSNGLTYQFDSAFASISQQLSALNGNGVACFQSTVIGGDVSGTLNNTGWLRGTPGSLDWLIRKGQTFVLGGNNPGTFEIGTLAANCLLNQSASALHNDRLSTTTTAIGVTQATLANDDCIFWSPPTGGSQLVVREGDDADPVNLPGVLFGTPVFAEGYGAGGQFALHSTLSGAGVSTTDDTSIWMGVPGNLQLLVREGMPATGLPAGVLIGQINAEVGYSDYQGGSVVFYCTLTDPTNGTITAFNETSIWMANGAGLQLIAREGGAVPGLANLPGYVSAVFGNSATGGSGIVAGTEWINDRGMVVFSVAGITLVDGSGTRNLLQSYCTWDAVAGLRLLFAAGVDAFPTLAGPVFGNSMTGLSFATGDGSTLSLNADGDVVFRVNITGGALIVRTHVGTLQCGPSSLSTLSGGVHTLRMNAGPSHAGRLFAMAATASGTRPGFGFGAFQVPLNPDWLLTESLNSLSFFGIPPWSPTLGTLDADGRGSVLLTVPANVPQFTGLDVDHAFAVVDVAQNVFHVSPPCGLRLY